MKNILFEVSRILFVLIAFTIFIITIYVTNFKINMQDWRILASASDDGTIKIWELREIS